MIISKAKALTTLSDLDFREVQTIIAALYLLYSEEQKSDIGKEYQNRFQSRAFSLYRNFQLAIWDGIIKF